MLGRLAASNSRRLHCHDAGFVQSVFRDVSQRLPSSNISAKRLALMTWAFATLGVDISAHDFFLQEIHRSLVEFRVEDFSLLSWGMIEGRSVEVGQRIQMAAVREMGRRRSHQDQSCLRTIGLGLIWYRALFATC